LEVPNISPGFAWTTSCISFSFVLKCHIAAILQIRPSGRRRYSWLPDIASVWWRWTVQSPYHQYKTLCARCFHPTTFVWTAGSTWEGLSASG
jgi:hypothetical protein